MPLNLPSRHRTIAFALIALLLVGAQTLGLAHRVLHGGHAASTQQADWFGHAPADELVCPLYDQLAAADPLPPAQPLVPPWWRVREPIAVAPAAQVPREPARRGYLARAPPPVFA